MQIASIIPWSQDDYLFYASCIFAISAFSVVVSLIETRKQAKSLHSMVSQGNTGTCSVLRPELKDISAASPASGEESQPSYVTVDHTQLVPGDLIMVPSQVSGSDWLYNYPPELCSVGLCHVL